VLPNYDKYISALTKSSRSFPWEDAYAYGLYLAQTYYYVCHSTRLLAVAAGRMSHADVAFHRRFLEHAAEEKGHEMMALKDLQNLGFSLEDFPELSETRMFWETQYYKIEHCDPLSVMGYILVLEAIACQECPWIKGEVEKFHPAKCNTFVRVHGEEDPEHVAKVKAQILSLPKERLVWVEKNFDQSAAALTLLLESIKGQALQRKLHLVA
jgi:hypothetical protein